MGAENEQSIDIHTEADQRGYLFRLSSRQLFILVGLIGSGLLAYALEEANLSVVVDFVWIIGYVTTIFGVWFIWIRPLDLVGFSGQDTSLTEESDQSETAIDGHIDESEASELSGLRRRIQRQRKKTRPRYLPKKIPETEEYGPVALGKWLGTENTGYHRNWFSARADHVHDDCEWEPAWNREPENEDEYSYPTAER